MCQSGKTYLPADCCFSELALLKSNLVYWSSTKKTSSYITSVNIKKQTAPNIDAGRHDLDCMVVAIGFPLHSVPITTNVASSNPVHGVVYSIQH